MKSNPWDRPEALSMLHEQWVDGIPVRQIAKNISRAVGLAVTHNAVVGKVHRLKLNYSHPRSDEARKDASARASRNRGKRPEGQKPRIASLGKRPAVAGIDYRLTAPNKAEREACRKNGAERVAWVEAGAGVVSLNARPFIEATGCRWPLSGGLVCCNSLGSRVYCAGHAAVAYDGLRRPHSAKILTRHDGVLDKYREAGGESTRWDEARLAA